jgi:hypothetical protein
VFVPFPPCKKEEIIYLIAPDDTPRERETSVSDTRRHLQKISCVPTKIGISMWDAPKRTMHSNTSLTFLVATVVYFVSTVPLNVIAGEVLGPLTACQRQHVAECVGLGRNALAS